MDPLAAAYAEALASERRRNADQIAWFRFLGASLVFALNLAFVVFRESYAGAPVLPLGLYCVVAGLVLWLGRRFRWLSRWSGIAVPLLDMPVVYLLITSAVATLHRSGYPADAAAVATQIPMFYLLFILLASLSLDARLIWLSAGVAMLLQTPFLLREGRDATFLAVINLFTALGAWLSLYVPRRSAALVRHAALEQTRRERLGRYFSPQVARVLAADRDLGQGQRCEVTLLFADLRDFTALAERLESEAVVALLNDFHSRMVERIFARGGTLDKYLGDGLMAYFGAPLPQSDHAERAVLCALEMQEEITAMNGERVRRELAALRMGVGIHTGSVVLGDVGAAQRREFTVVGDTVNVAARIEQYTKTAAAPVLVSEATQLRVGAGVGVRFTALEAIALKGKSESVRVYRAERA